MSASRILRIAAVALPIALFQMGCGSKSSDRSQHASDPEDAPVVKRSETVIETGKSEPVAVDPNESKSLAAKTQENGPNSPSETETDEQQTTDVESATTGEVASEPEAGSIATDEGIATDDGNATEADVTNDPTSMTMPAKPNEPPDLKDHYRIWLPTTAGPVLVGVSVFVNDLPLRQAFDEKLAFVARKVGESSDSPDALSWDALFEVVSNDAMTFGQTSSRIDNQQRGLIKRYDRNKNDRVDDDELVRFLFRDSQFAGEFRVFGTDAFCWSNRTSSPLFAAIDSNDDRRLDSTEIENAASSLFRNIDHDSDNRISMIEAMNVADFDENAWQRNRSNRQGNVAMDLVGFVNWSNLAYAIGGMLKSDPPFAIDHPATNLDENSDQWIDSEEAEKLMGTQPSLSLTVRFGTTGPSATSVRLMPTRAAKDKLVGGSAERNSAWITDRSLKIVASTTDTPTRQNRIPREAFDQLDANNDGAIDETEIPDGVQERLPIEKLDTNGDGKLTFMEINQALRQSESIWNYQIRSRAAEHPDGLFAWLDEDNDNSLSSREIRIADQKLAALRGTKSSLRATDIPDTFLIQFARGEPNQDDQRFQLQRRVIGNEEESPTWFRRMDSNGDFEISELEFIGPIETFDKLDADNDRFLSLREAVKE